MAAPLYDPAADPMLSAEAKRLDPDVVTAHAVMAESLLGLEGTTYTGEEATKAQHAVAIQVSYQIRQGVDAFVLSSVGRGARAESYKAAQNLVHPLAKEIVDELAGVAVDEADADTWTTVRSFR